MVTVGLIVFMLGVFSSVLTTATGTVSLQKSVSEAGQRIRATAHLLRNDLEDLFIVGGQGDWPPTLPAASGYLEISENYSADGTTGVDVDDVIQFTCLVPEGVVGRVPQDSGVDNDTSISGNYTSDGLVRAQLAEVCYFMRPVRTKTSAGDNVPWSLYRRIRLLGREVYPRSGQTLHDNAWDVADGAVDDMDERHLRFGHYHETSTTDVTTITGWPADTTDANFVSADHTNWAGRPTKAQTTVDTYPNTAQHNMDGGAGGTKVPPVLSPGTVGLGAGEDLLATGVVSFDVKVWDRAADQFVDLGGTGAVDYAGTGLGSPTPNVPACTFDTWSTSYDLTRRPMPYTTASGDPPPFPRAIEITIRLRDPYNPSSPPRQVTVVVDLLKK